MLVKANVARWDDGVSLDVKTKCDLPISELLLVVLYQYNL